MAYSPVAPTAVDSDMGVRARRENAGKYAPSPVEMALMQLIIDRDAKAKSASLFDRREMHVNAMKAVGEWGTWDVGDDTAAYYANIIGRSKDTIIDNVQDAIFPDPCTYTHVEALGTSKGTRVDPDFDISAAIMRARGGRLAERAMGIASRDMMAFLNYQEIIGGLNDDCVTMGTSFATVEPLVTFDAKSPEAADADDMGLAGVEDIAESEGYAPSMTRAERKAAKVPKPKTLAFGPEVIDPRNFFTGSVEDDRGIERQEWFTIYKPVTWKYLWDRRKREDGSGCYRNLEFIGEPTESLHRIFYDDILSGGWNGTNGMLPIEAWQCLERGYRVLQYIGFIGAGIIRMPNGGLPPTPGEYREHLRAWGMDPDDVRYAGWWVQEIAFPGDTTFSGTSGVTIRFEVHPFKRGEECPVIMDRFRKIRGRFYGASIFKPITADEDLYNDFVRFLWNQALTGAKPPYTVNKNGIDPDDLAENDGDAGSLLKPGRGVSIVPDQLFNSKAFEFIVPPAESGQWSQIGMDITKTNIQEVTGVNPADFGKLEARVTATNVAAARQAIQVKIKWLAVARETNMVNPLANMLMECMLDTIRSSKEPFALQLRTVADVDAIGPLDPTIAALSSSGELSAADFEVLLPLEVILEKELFEGGFKVVVGSNAASGGRDALANGLRELLANALQIQQVQPSFQFDFVDLALSIANASGVPRPERWQMDSADQARALSFEQRSMMEQKLLGASGATAKPLGQPSAPAESEQFDPGEVV